MLRHNLAEPYPSPEAPPRPGSPHNALLSPSARRLPRYSTYRRRVQQPASDSDLHDIPFVKQELKPDRPMHHDLAPGRAVDHPVVGTQAKPSVPQSSALLHCQQAPPHLLK